MVECITTVSGSNGCSLERMTWMTEVTGMPVVREGQLFILTVISGANSG